MEDDIYDGTFIPKGSLVRRLVLSVCAWRLPECVLGVCEYLVCLSWMYACDWTSRLIRTCASGQFFVTQRSSRIPTRSILIGTSNRLRTRQWSDDATRGPMSLALEGGKRVRCAQPHVKRSHAPQSMSRYAPRRVLGVAACGFHDRHT